VGVTSCVGSWCGIQNYYEPGAARLRSRPNQIQIWRSPMEIRRRASRRYRGTKAIIPPLSLNWETDDSWKKNVRWDAEKKEIVIRASNVPHSDGRTNHHYFIRLSLEDVSALLTLLGHAGSASDASLLRDHLAEHVPALVKLLACATGLVPKPMAEPEPCMTGS
jgi:hypothetical protein